MAGRRDEIELGKALEPRRFEPSVVDDADDSVGRRALAALRILAADRAADRVLRVAWTLSDLAGRTVPGPDEVAEALGMRLQRVAA